jgi:hypothetical protein
MTFARTAHHHRQKLSACFVAYYPECVTERWDGPDGVPTGFAKS